MMHEKRDEKIFLFQYFFYSFVVLLSLFFFSPAYALVPGSPAQQAARQQALEQAAGQGRVMYQAPADNKSQRKKQRAADNNKTHKPKKQ